jgi:hypothetical protein
LLFACLTGLAACGENDEQRAARATVTRFYEALKNHDARTACGLVSPGVAASLLRASGEQGKPCVAGLRDLFHRIATSPDPHLFDSTPTAVAATVHGDNAIVVLKRGYQRRRVGLTRVGDRWQITVPPDFG